MASIEKIISALPISADLKLTFQGFTLEAFLALTLSDLHDYMGFPIPAVIAVMGCIERMKSTHLNTSTQSSQNTQGEKDNEKYEARAARAARAPKRKIPEGDVLESNERPSKRTRKEEEFESEERVSELEIRTSLEVRAANDHGYGLRPRPSTSTRDEVRHLLSTFTSVVVLCANDLAYDRPKTAPPLAPTTEAVNPSTLADSEAAHNLGYPNPIKPLSSFSFFVPTTSLMIGR